MSKNIHQFKIRYLIYILFFIIFVLIITAIIRSQVAKRYEAMERQNIVVCFDKDEDWDGDSYNINIVSLTDCASAIVDYSEEKQTLLYQNSRGTIVEKEINTGEEKIIEIPLLRNQSTEVGRQAMIDIRYTLNQDEISFAFDHNIYCYNTETQDTEKVTEIYQPYNDWRDLYQWKNQQEIYIIRYVEEIRSEGLFLVNLGKGTVQEIQSAIRSFIESRDNKKLYGIQLYVIPNAFGFEMRYRIVEIDAETGNSTILRELDSENQILKCIDGKYLYYVEQHSNKKWNKLFCMNLETGKEKCIYKTKDNIVGIVVK